jgi:signal transduction histidine kinase
LKVDVSRPRETNSGRIPRVPTIVGFCLLALAGIAAVVGTFTSADADRWFAHSLEVRQAEAQLFIAVQDAETGQRGYLLTGDLSYLPPFTEAQRRLAALQAALRALTQDNAQQQGRLAQLDAAIDAKMRELNRTVILQQQGRTDEALATVKTNAGSELMRQVRALTSDFDAAEREVLKQRREQARLMRIVLAVVVPLSVGLAAVLAMLVARAARLYETALENRNTALATEMAQREAAEAQLRQAHKMEALGQLTGGVAHDFNNMLAIIVGNLDILVRRLAPDDSKLKTMVENALNGAQRAAALTQRLLAFSRLQPLDPKPIDVNKCVGEMSEILRRTLGEKIIVETVLAGGLWRAFVDRPQLESAILNLSVNARDAMAEGGRLTLETSNASLDQAYADVHAEVTPGQYVLVAVTDTGAGMTQEIMAKAFDPFFTTKEAGEGTGLGLSQVHGFLKQSRGHIKLYSELGVGTSVKLYIPRDRSGRPVEEIAREVETTRIEQRFTVLVVEDDPGVRQVAVSALRELGFKILEADCTAVALERLAEHDDITVLLTDVIMPGLDGRKLVDAALQSRPDLRILYMTGYTRNAIVHNGVLDPGTRLITKPFTIGELDRELRLILSDKL